MGGAADAPQPGGFTPAPPPPIVLSPAALAALPDPGAVDEAGWNLAGLETEPPCPPRSPTPASLPRPADGGASPDWRRVPGFALAEPRMEAPSPGMPSPTPAPTVREIIPREGPQPIRVVVEQRRAESTIEIPEEPPPSELVPDDQRTAWVQDRLHELALEIRDYAAWIRPLHDLVSEVRSLLERADKRDAERVREERERTRAEQEALVSRPRWQRIIAHKHAGRAFALLTHASGVVVGGVLIGLLDYLGLETEPVMRFFLAMWGAL